MLPRKPRLGAMERERCQHHPATVPGSQSLSSRSRRDRHGGTRFPSQHCCAARAASSRDPAEGRIRSIQTDPVTGGAAGSSFEACLQCGHSPRTRFHLLPGTHRPSRGQQPLGGEGAGRRARFPRQMLRSHHGWSGGSFALCWHHGTVPGASPVAERARRPAWSAGPAVRQNHHKQTSPASN